ncbi:MAG: WbqC family protein, partial [Acidobacteriota bacterium]
MILAAHQPQFAPWLGFFDKLDRADVFVLLDNVQYKKNEWQNRNRIKASTGPQWLTVPVSFRFGQTIGEVAINHRQKWQRQHLASLRACYGRAPHFGSVFSLYEELLRRPWDRLSELN